MSRVGKKPVEVPKSVKIEIKDDMFRVEGPKGKLEHRIPGLIVASLKEGNVVVGPKSGILDRHSKSLLGLTRTIIVNLIKGVTQGYLKELEIRGVGFKAQIQGNVLQLNLGFSHPIKYTVPEGITVTTPKPILITVAGMDKVKVGEVAAEIRDFYKAEPYTGKGLRYIGEHVRHKAGKTVTK